jgi:hypothetical protein
VLRLLSPLKIHLLAGFEPTILESSGKHINHYTTEATPTYVSPAGVFNKELLYLYLDITSRYVLSGQPSPSHFTSAVFQSVVLCTLVAWYGNVLVLY